MKVLQVTDADLPGRHFNGYDLLEPLLARGIEGRQAVFRKLGRNPKVLSLSDGRADEELQHRLREAERRHSIVNLLYPWARVLSQSQEFQDADVVHYHLIHNQVISLYDMGWLLEAKPSVWTFHDPWPLTGHCVHPMGCEGWLAGCDPCPHLDRHFSIAVDRAGEMWRAKQRLFSGADLDVVVASDWMHDLVRRSPLTSHLQRVHLIPFGIDTAAYAADDQQAASRRRLGIRPDDFVVFFRASPWELKGLAHIVEALASNPPNRPTTLLTVDKKGMLSRLHQDYRIVELGWVEDDTLYPIAFSACDVFVMPSLAEGFGLMAIEAMAAGRPVVCFEDTALTATTHAPECGIAVTFGDAAAIREALDRLAADPSEGARRGRLGREIAAREYGYERYLDAMAELYLSIHAQHRTTT
jgi:glycosyltransferase involved in cell wall biosynthesis